VADETPDSQMEGAREPNARGRPTSHTTVAVLLAVAAVLAAAIGARAALLADEGSDTWHGAVRADVKAGAAVVEDSRFVYGEEAAQAFQLTEAKLRARELRKEASDRSGEAKALLEAQAKEQDQLAQTLSQSSSVAGDPRYAARDGGFDAVRRLADRRAKNPELTRLDPDATEKRGADRSREASLLVGAVVIVAIAFLLGALAEGFPGLRRILVPAGFAMAGIGLVAALAVEVSL